MTPLCCMRMTIRLKAGKIHETFLPQRLFIKPLQNLYSGDMFFHYYGPGISLPLFQEGGRIGENFEL